MTLKELFEKAQISEEISAKLTEAMKGAGSKGNALELVVANNGEYVKADKHDSMKTELETLKIEYASKQKMLEDVDIMAKGKTDLEEQLKLLKETSTKERQVLEKKQQFISKLIKDEVPMLKDGYDYILNDIDYEKIIRLENGRFDGIDTQYKNIRETNPDFFSKVKAKVIDAGSGGNPPPIDKTYTKNDIAKLGYEGLAKLQQENPTAYAELIKN